jgi:hypothetical protein
MILILSAMDYTKMIISEKLSVAVIIITMLEILLKISVIFIPIETVDVLINPPM